MTMMRNTLLATLIEDISRLERDMAELHGASRNWAQGSKAHLSLRQVEKDFRLFEARMKALIGEIDHLEARNRQFTGATMAPVRHAQPTPALRPAAPAPPAAVAEPAEAAVPEAVAEPTGPESREDFQIVDEPVEHHPSTISSDGRRKLAEMANDLPPSVLAELKKAGLV
jgi:hypothetical protein